MPADSRIAQMGWRWIPLTTISFQLDYEFYGLEPAGFLLTNAVLHAISTLLLFAALTRMTRATWPSAFVAAVFAVHPLHVEPVAWVAARPDALAGVFWMLGILAWARYTERPSLGAYGIVALCLALGLLAKPVVVTLPFVLLLLDYWPLRRLAPAGAAAPWPLDRARLSRAVLEKLPLLVLVAVASAITFMVQLQPGVMFFSDQLSLAERLANAAVSYAVYLAQSVWPSGLAVYYSDPVDGLPTWQVVGAAALLALLSALALRMGAHAAVSRRRLALVPRHARPDDWPGAGRTLDACGSLHVPAARGAPRLQRRGARRTWPRSAAVRTSSSRLSAPRPLQGWPSPRRSR